MLPKSIDGRPIVKHCRLMSLAALCSCACTSFAPAASGGIVEAGLLAEAGGPGGCRSIAQVDSMRESFFPGIVLVRGLCVRVHGDTAFSFVGVDSIGTIYLLDSPSSFRFLLRRHPPVSLVTDSLVRYAWLALQFSGALEPGSTLIESPEQVPAAALTSSGMKRDEVISSGIQRFPHGAEVIWISAMSGGVLQTFGVAVEKLSGEIVIVSHPPE
jgi:hypothetical protein